MEKDLSLILLIFAGVILLLLFIYSFRTRVKSNDYKTSELDEFDRFNEDEKDILTMSLKNNGKSTTIDYDNEFEALVVNASNNIAKNTSQVNHGNLISETDDSSTHVEPRLNTLVIEDDSFIIHPTLKHTVQTSQSIISKENPVNIVHSINTNNNLGSTQIENTIANKPLLKPADEQNLQQVANDIPTNFQPSSLLTLHVMPQEGQQFFGYDLLQALLSAKFRFGKMSIFHRHESANGDGKILFSVAQVTEPGSFSMAGIGSCQCAGLVLFMQLLGPEHNLEALDTFIHTAQQLADSLDGILMEKRCKVFTTDAKKHFIASIQHHLDKMSVVA